MAFFSKLFAKKDGGTFVGRLWRSFVDNKTGGIFHLMENLQNRDESE